MTDQRFRRVLAVWAIAAAITLVLVGIYVPEHTAAFVVLVFVGVNLAVLGLKQIARKRLPDA